MSNISESKTTASDVSLTFDETSLIQRVQSGQTALFSDLILRYQDRLYNLAYRLTGGPEDAADLTQETFTRAIKGIGYFRGESRFSTWLVRIMINIINDWKGKIRQQRDIQQQMQSILSHSQAGEMFLCSDPQVQAQSREMVELLWQAIDLMDLPHREVLLLRDMEQLSYQEIAQVLRITEGTVKSRLFRARENLRELLAPVLKLSSEGS